MKLVSKYKKKVLIALTMSACAAMVLGFNAQPVHAEEIGSDCFEVRGGSIKYDSGTNDDGMRIHVRMTESTYTESIGKEVGVLIIPEYDLDGGSLTYATDKVLKVVFDENDWDDISEPDTVSGETETDKEAITSLIYKQNGTPVDPAIYNAVILARGYVRDGDNITYTNVWGKSIADIALDFIDDEEHAEELDAYLNTYTVKFYDTDGTTVLNTQSVKYGSEFNAYEKEIDGTKYQKWYKKASDGNLAAEEYDFNATGAKVVKKNLKYQARVYGRTITFDEGITVKDSNGTTITSGTNVSAGEYTASIEGNKNVVTYLQDADDNKIVSAVNGTSYYTFYLGDEQLEFSTATGSFSTSNTMTEQQISNLAYVSDPSVIYENGKYYMVLCTNWADSDFELDKQFIWEIFEADTVDDLLNYRTVSRHLVMTLADFATEVDGAYSGSGNWAPELQKIGDYYYIITTYVCTDHAAENDSASNRPVENSHRTTAILRSRSLTEGWTVWASHLSPVNGDKGWDTIDGIIYQEKGNSYLVVSHEHTSQNSLNGGSYAYVQLKDDLSGIAPSATWNEMFYAKTITHSDNQVTDGPYLYRNSKGDLLMLWTNNGGYTSGDYYDVMMAKSSNGSITGSWTNVGALYSRKTSGLHVEYDNDGSGTLEAVSGGHTGLVETPEGQLYMFFHINHQENISDGAPKRLVAVAVYEDATTGYLKWGLNPNNKFVELTPEGNAEVTRTLAWNNDISNFTAEFTVRKDRTADTYVGFKFEQKDGSVSEILLKTFNGAYATVGISADGNEVNTITDGKTVALGNGDLITLTVTYSVGSMPMVFINGVYSAELTAELGLAFSLNHNVSAAYLLAKGSTLERFIDYSFTAGTVSVPQMSKLTVQDGLTVRENNVVKTSGSLITFGTVLSVFYTNNTGKPAQVFVNGGLLGVVADGETLTENYTVDSIITDVRVYAQETYVTYGSDVSVAYADGTTVVNGSSTEYNEKVLVTVTNSDKTKVARLFVNGSDSGYVVVNGSSTFEYAITENSNFTVRTANYPVLFTADDATNASKVNDCFQGIDNSGYLVGPNTNERSSTSTIQLNKDTVFESTVKLNKAYTFGFVFFVGQSNFNISLRPWDMINNVGTFLQTYVQIQNGSTATNNPILSGVENDEVTVKVIFDSEAGKIYAFVNGMNVSDCITTSYGGTETLSAKFSYLCEAGSLAGYYKDWKILSGRAAVEKAISESYSTESYNGSKTNSFVGTVNIANDGVGKTTQTMIFDAIITAESDTYEAGLQLICEGANADASIIYVTVSGDKVYAYNYTVAGNADHGSRFWTITASRTHRLQLKVSAHGALYIWVDGVQQGGYFMTGFGNTSATMFGKYSCWVINGGTDNVNVTYNFGGHKITASDITGTLTTDGTSGYYMSEKIAEMNLPAAGSSAMTVSDVFTFGVIPTASGFAGVRVEDEFGYYFTLRITTNGWQIYKQGASSAFKAGDWTNKDGVYNLWLSMQARRVFNILEDRKGTAFTAQFIDSVGSATNLGLSSSAIKVSFYLIWTDGDTVFNA